MSDILRVSLVQSELSWGDVDANLSKFNKLLAPLKNKTDLIVLPEMFTSGFLMKDKENIAVHASRTFDWMKMLAMELDSVITGSIIVEEDNRFYNRLLCVNKDGLMAQYDKRHLFRMGDEQNHFEGGKKREVFKIGKWRICPLICYDLRFPVWSRNRNEYDLLLYVANWPEARKEVWNTLLKARAIENQSYVVGVNRVGTDGMNLSYSGGTMAIDAYGKPVECCEDHKEQVLTVSLSLDALMKFRQKFPVLDDGDHFLLDNNI